MDNSVLLLRRSAKIEAIRRDFPGCFENQFQIRPPVGPIVHAPLKFTQKLVDDVIQRQLKEHGWIRVCEFKARQHGGSTHGVGRAAHGAFFNENVKALIIAQDDATTANLFNMATLMYESVDADIRPIRRYLNKQAIVLENPDDKTRPQFPGLRSSIIIQSAKNVHAGVGTTPNWLHLSEYCRFGRVQELKTSLIPAIHLVPGTAVIAESAPFGYGEGRDEFRLWCDAARSGKSPYKFIGIYWWMDTQCQLPLMKGQTIKRTMEEKRLVSHVKRISAQELGREFILTDEQLNYRRVRIQELGNGDDTVGEQLYQGQYPTDYESGWFTLSLSVFDNYKVEKAAQSGMIRNPVWVGDVIQDRIVQTSSGPLWIWEEPVPGEIYDMGVDTASGIKGGDFSAFQIIKRRNKEQVAEYRATINPLDYAKVVYRVAMYYNTAQVGVEVEGIGYAVNESLLQMGYAYLYQWRQRQHMFPKLSSFSGWKTQQDTKKLLVAIGQDIVNSFGSDHDTFTIHSTRLLSEMRRFIRDFTDGGNEVYFASEGNDDCLMAWLITQVISRDEDALGRPPEIGDHGQEPKSFEERAALFAKHVAESGLAFQDTPAQSNSNDPFAMLAAAMRQR